VRAPLNIGRTAFALIRLYGEDGAEVAQRRSDFCANRDQVVAAAEWRLVVRKIDEFLLDRQDRPQH
jgi:hypothetical protein